MRCVYSKTTEEQENYLLKLNNFQLEAVKTFEKPILILAGAGSGKTRVITSKIAEIINTKKAFPFQILAVTFTNKAANEMFERVRASCDSVNEMNIGTFHSVCVKMLRKNADLVGFNSNFSIADSADQKKLIKSIMDSLEIDTKVFAPNKILDFISRVKEKFLNPYELEANLRQFPNIYREAKLDQIYKLYQERLLLQNIMDFDDLLFFTVRLLSENPDVLAYYRECFRYILVDEYQDINALQYRWFRLLASDNKNICVVGDDDQSIYGWRGADVGIILSFTKDFPDAKIIKLEQNYRSTGNIIKCADTIIANNKNRLGKKLFTEEMDGEKVKITCYSDSKIEAKEIVSKIENSRKMNSRKYSDFAILVRASSQTRILEEALIALGIPYKIIGSLKFYERREIKDILAYIKIINGMEDDIAMERIIKTPKKGIGDTSIEKLIEFGRKKQISLVKACFDITSDNPSESGIIGIKALKTLTDFTNCIKKWGEDASFGTKALIQTVMRVIDEIRYFESLKEEDEDQIEAREANINELLNLMQSFESINAFLEHISLVSNNDELTAETEDAVKILTIHASKGLEFPIVFLPGWEEGLFPSGKTVDEIGVEEERRLAYVGITRAMENVFISHTKMRMIHGGFNKTRESIFVAELKATKCVEYRDKTSGMESGISGFGYGRKYEICGQRFKGGSFVDEIKGVAKKKIDFMDKGATVKHKVFGTGTVSRKISTNLFEVVFDDMETKTIRGDFLIFVKGSA